MPDALHVYLLRLTQSWLRRPWALCKSMQDLYFCWGVEHDTAIKRCARGRERRVQAEDIPYDGWVCAEGSCTWWRDHETLTEVMVSAEATISARPALMMCSSRSLSIGSIPLGTLSIRENIRCNSDGDRELRHDWGNVLMSCNVLMRQWNQRWTRNKSQSFCSKSQTHKTL